MSTSVSSLSDKYDLDTDIKGPLVVSEAAMFGSVDNLDHVSGDPFTEPEEVPTPPPASKNTFIRSAGSRDQAAPLSLVGSGPLLESAGKHLWFGRRGSAPHIGRVSWLTGGKKGQKGILIYLFICMGWP